MIFDKILMDGRTMDGRTVYGRTMNPLESVWIEKPTQLIGL